MMHEFPYKFIRYSWLDIIIAFLIKLAQTMARIYD